MFKTSERKYLAFLLGIVFLHLFLLFKLKFTAWPEMLLWPYLIIHGLLPYKDIAIAHTPHLIIDLSIFAKFFGTGLFQLKIYTWSIIIFTDLLIFWVSKKLWNQKVALIAVSIFSFWQIFFDGNGLWFDLMLTPLAVFTFFFLEKKKYFWVGVFWVFMFFTKQTAVWFLIPILFSVKEFKSFVYGILLAASTLLIGIWLWGILPNFYHWAINFGIFVLPKAQGQIQLPGLKNLFVSLFPFLIFLPFIIKTKTKGIGLLLWAFAGLMGVYPRYEYFHFQPAIPFLAIVSGLVFTKVDFKNKMFKTFVALYFLGSLYLLSNYLLRNYEEGTRFVEQEVLDVVSYVKNNTKSNDKIFVINYWDNIYPLTSTLPATDPWVPQLSWYQEIPGIQEEEVKDLQISKPKLILLQKYSEIGLSSYKPGKVLDYVMANFKLKETIDGVDVLIPR